MSSQIDLALISSAVLGLRHGFDYDHWAAISDIASVQEKPSRSMRLGLYYAMGHAATVAVLGVLVIVFQASLPSGLDRWAERMVGATLLLLGLYVMGTLLRKQEVRVPRTRLSLLIQAFRWSSWKLRQSLQLSAEAPPSFLAWNYDARTVFGIGIVHGLGAETPSQLLLFLLAANLGGISKGLLGLSMFLAGLLCMNTIMTASAAGIFGAGAGNPRWLRLATALTAGYSLAVGAVFLWGGSSLLPQPGI